MGCRTHAVPRGMLAVEDENEPSLRLEDLIDPAHLLKAIENALRYSVDAPCGVTGLSFERYRIIVRQGKDFTWHVQCRFKQSHRPSDRARARRTTRRRLRP
jgi:hypothetical protein